MSKLKCAHCTTVKPAVTWWWSGPRALIPVTQSTDSVMASMPSLQLHVHWGSRASIQSRTIHIKTENSSYVSLSWAGPAERWGAGELQSTVSLFSRGMFNWERQLHNHSLVANLDRQDHHFCMTLNQMTNTLKRTTAYFLCQPEKKRF